jgi:hypothetical protein
LAKRRKNWKPKQARKTVESYIKIHTENKYRWTIWIPLRQMFILVQAVYLLKEKPVIVLNVKGACYTRKHETYSLFSLGISQHVTAYWNWDWSSSIFKTDTLVNAVYNFLNQTWHIR